MPAPEDARRTPTSGQTSAAGCSITGGGGAVLGLILLLWSAFPASALAQEPGSGVGGDSERGDVSARQRDLEAIRREMGSLESRLEDLGGTVRGLEGELERIEVELALQKIRLDEARAARDVAVEQAEIGQRAVSALEGELTTIRDRLEVRLRTLYRLGLYGYLRLLLSIDPGADPLEAVRVLRYLARRDAEVVSRYRTVQERLDAQQQALEARRRESEEWATREEERRQGLDRLRRRQASLLKRAEAQRLAVAARAEELKDKERKLESFLDALAGQSEEPLEGRPIQEFRGVLDWPLRGEVEIGFGPRRDPRYQTELPHSGISLEVPVGEAVRAVYPGTVLFAAPFEGYGTMVVVHHPGRVFSIYAGLAQIGVAQGDVLRLNQSVGVSSDTLYFEIRVEKDPEDPLSWLR